MAVVTLTYIINHVEKKSALKRAVAFLLGSDEPEYVDVEDWRSPAAVGSGRIRGRFATTDLGPPLLAAGDHQSPTFTYSGAPNLQFYLK